MWELFWGTKAMESWTSKILKDQFCSQSGRCCFLQDGHDLTVIEGGNKCKRWSLKNNGIITQMRWMYGIFTYIMWRMTTFKGKCRWIFLSWSIWVIKDRPLELVSWFTYIFCYPLEKGIRTDQTGWRETIKLSLELRLERRKENFWNGMTHKNTQYLPTWKA